MVQWTYKKIQLCAVCRKTHFSYKATHMLKVKGEKNDNQKRADVTYIK